MVNGKFQGGWVAAMVLVVVLAAAGPLEAQPGDASPGGLGGLFGGSGLDSNVVAISAEILPATGDVGAELSITATMQPPWYIYSITQPPGGPVATTIELGPSDDFRLTGPFVASPEPERKQEPIFNNLTVEAHHGRVTWRAPLELSPGVALAALNIQGVVRAQPCDPNSCLPPQDFPFTAALGQRTDSPPRTTPAPPVEPSGPPSEGTTVSSASFDLQRLQVDANDTVLARPMWRVLVLGFLGGLILNIMPCVLPVIGLKVLSFVEQAGHSRQHALLLNIWYALGMMAVFMALASLAVFAGFGWGQLFQLAGFNIILAAVVFVMALGFLGVWEVPIPGFIGAGRVAEWGQKEGAIGAFSKGVLTTVLATPCTAPFLGSALAWAVSQPAPRAFAAFGAVGLGMASPYLLLGVFPELLRFLPKPGAWMETFKQLMGFVLLGTVVFLLTFTAWPYVVPTIGLLFGLWAACWWIGRIKITASFEAKARAWAEATAFAAVVWVLMFPGIDGVVSGRFTFRGLREVMQGRFDRAQSAQWQPFTQENLRKAIASNKTVVVDFTADWCLTCKTLEAQVLDTLPVRRLLESDDVVALKADWTHGDPEVTATLTALGSKQVPVIAVFPAARPNRPTVFRDGYTQDSLLTAIEEARR